MHPIGRALEVERIASAVLAGASILLVGDAGVGKSHLAGAVAGSLAIEGWRHEWIHATPSMRSVHFGAFQHLVGTQAHPSLEASIAAAEQRIRLMGQVLLVVDDIDYLDDGTAALIHRAAASGVSVLATARTGGASDPNVLSLWKDELLERMEVVAPSADNTGALAETFLGGPLAEPDAVAIAELTLGNPLFIRELLADARNVGELIDQDGVWTFTAPPAPRGRISDLLTGRFEHLAPDDRDTLELVALGEPLPVAVLERVTAPERLELLERNGLVSLSQVGDANVVRSSHPLIGEVVRAASSELGQRRRMQLLAGAVVEADDARPADVIRAVAWLLDTGAVPPAPAALAAAGAALTAFDGAAAKRFVHASGQTDTPTLVMLGRAHLLNHSPQEAVDALTRAVDIAATDVEHASASTALAEVFLFALGDIESANRILTDALAHVTEPNPRAAIASIVMLSAGLAGDFQPSLDLGRSLLAEPELDDTSRLSLLRMTTLAQAVTGHRDGLEADLETGLKLALVTDPVTHELLQVNQWLWALDEVGLGETRQRLVQDIARPHRSAGLDCLPTSGLAAFDLFRGDGAAAVEYSTRALDDPSGEVVGMGSVLNALAAWAHAWTGADDVAMALHDKALGHPRNGPRERPYLGLARSAVLANTGDLDAAVEECLRGARESGGNHLWAIWLLHSAVRFGRADAVRSTLDEQTTFFDTAFCGVMIEHARALDDSDVIGLVKVAGLFGEQGAQLFAAEALAQASAIVQIEDESAQLAQRAWVRFDRCNGIWSIAMNSIERPLSDREDEVARMAATGVTSREIADHLFVSQRTVDNHLRSIYRKLGIAQRADLAPLFA